MPVGTNVTLKINPKTRVPQANANNSFVFEVTAFNNMYQTWDFFHKEYDNNGNSAKGIPISQSFMKI